MKRESILTKEKIRIHILTKLQPGIKPKPGLTPEVCALVVAARVVAFEDQSKEALHQLDKASEAFAQLVPWDE